MRSVLGRLQDDEGGFTLIELLVAIIIVAILAAILVPDLLGAKGSAQDSRAKAALDTAKTAAGEYFVTHNESFAGFGPELNKRVPTLKETKTATATGEGVSNPLEIIIIKEEASLLEMCSAPNKGTAVWCMVSNGKEWGYGESIDAKTNAKETVETAGKATNSYGGTSSSVAGIKGFSTEGF